MSGVISAAAGRGLSLRVTPGYGVTASGMQQLWQQGLVNGLGDNRQGGGLDDYSPNMDVRLDYGLDAPRGSGLLTPYTELRFGNTNTYRLDLQWQRNQMFDLKLVTERQETLTTDEHRIYLMGAITFSHPLTGDGDIPPIASPGSFSWWWGATC